MTNAILVTSGNYTYFYKFLEKFFKDFPQCEKSVEIPDFFLFLMFHETKNRAIISLENFNFANNLNINELTLEGL